MKCADCVRNIKKENYLMASRNRRKAYPTVRKCDNSRVNVIFV